MHLQNGDENPLTSVTASSAEILQSKIRKLNLVINMAI